MPSCSWRRKHAQFIQRYIPDLDMKNQDGRITYLERMEMMGLQGPTSARERNMLNLVALHPETTPLDTTLAVVDLSQGLDRFTFMANGVVPTLATNSKPWSIRHGRALRVGELMALRGLPSTADMSGMRGNAARAMLGNCMHVADVRVAAATACFLALGLLG